MTALWQQLSSGPLLWLSLSLVVYLLANWLYERSGQMPLLHPLLTAAIVLVSSLVLTKTSYASYFNGTQLLHFLLGPATVGLAVPLAQQWSRVKRYVVPLSLALFVGAIVGIASAWLFGTLFGLDELALRSMLAKSVTTPIAMGITEQIAGLPSLTAVIVIFTGVLGAVMALPLLRFCRIKDDAARGLALGTAAHGVGTARAFQLSAETGAFAGLAIGLCGVITALLVPVFAWLLGWL